MDFFANQEHAEKQTRLMLLLFVLAVMSIVLSINLVSGVICLYYSGIHATSAGQALSAIPHKTYWITSVAVLGVIAFGTLTRMSALSGGGAAVAEMVGARRVKPDGSDSAEQRLVNVVEEMAIASGIRMPLIYVMDDQHGINAFAAGYSPDGAAVTVTRGALERLSRDELQGVVAHEFSHILNGDMRLNIRLIGVIAGIVAIGGIGRFLMNLGRGGDSGYLRRRGDVRLIALGFVIWLIGSIGVFFGTLIKAAVSRQREFLADASAVQFTRNPEGIAAALYRIFMTGSGVFQRYADELSHMYFSAAASDFFATHPPVEERITKIMGPGAIRLLRDRIKPAPQMADSGGKSTIVDAFTSSIPAAIDGDGTLPFVDYTRSMATPLVTPAGVSAKLRITPAEMLSSVGTLSQVRVEQARHLIDQLPAEVRRAVNTGAGARAALFSLVLGQGDVRTRQLDLVSKRCNQMMAIETGRLADLLQPLGAGVRMPVFDLAIASMRFLDVIERGETVAIVEAMINADNKVTLGEFVMLTLCRSQLRPLAKGLAQIKYQTLQEASKPAATLLSMLLRPCQAGPEVYARIVANLALVAVNQSPQSGITFQGVEAALGELKLLAPQGKAAFIKACLDIVVEDGQITLIEAELMRAICASIEVPLPPIIETKPGNMN